MLTLNQIPVLTVDQPLCLLSQKRYNGHGLNVYGEDKFVVMMGGLHIELSFLKVLGDWLEGSGWTSILATSNVTTEGRADSILKGSHSSRAQWVHQVSVAALYILQTLAYEVYKANTDTNHMPFEEWRVSMAREHPQFYYWNKTLQLELLFLQFFEITTIFKQTI